jgi:REP element-mobilizing transposase RayT
MSNYRQIYYHLVFRTKNSRRVFIQKKLPDLFQYVWGITKEKQCHLYRINGMEEHIHIFSDLHPAIALSDYIRDIKTSSSLWIKQKGIFPLWEGWSTGYCALTYGHKDKNTIINYVKNQQAHHKKESFEREYERLLIESGIKIDYNYFLKD